MFGRLWRDTQNLELRGPFESMPMAVRHDHELTGVEGDTMLIAIHEEDDSRASFKGHYDLVPFWVTLPLGVSGVVANKDRSVSVRRNLQERQLGSAIERHFRRAIGQV